MKVEIYHVKTSPEHAQRFGYEHGLSWEKRRIWYDHIATLEVPEARSVEEALNCAWNHTQHGSGAWSRSPFVTLSERPEAEVRSSAIGDVFVVYGAPGSPVSLSGIPYQVDFEGFSDISAGISRVRKAGGGPVN